MLWTFRPRLWDGPGVGAAAGGPGGVSLCGDVSGVLGWDDGPPASRARRLRRISSALSSSIAFLLMVNAKGGRAPSSAPPTGSSAERSPAASAPHKGIAGAASPRPPAADPSAAPGPPPAARPRLGSAPAAPREEPPAACRAPARAPRPQLPSAPRPLPRAEIIHQNKRAAAAAILGAHHTYTGCHRYLLCCSKP